MLRPALLAFAVTVFACKPTPATEPDAALPSATESATESEPDARVARLCGTWRARAAEDATVTESWQPSDEGLVGQGETTDAEGQVIGRESLLLSLEPERSIYRALPEGAEGPTDFEQTVDQPGGAADQWIWSWHNPEHDFPQTIRYIFVGSDRMDVSLSGPDGEGGTQEFGWSFERVAPCSAAGATGSQ